MRGVGESTAAITVVNALGTGIGCAIGIDLRARAEVTLHPKERRESAPRVTPERSRTALVQASLKAGLARFHGESSETATLTLSSEIPVAKGLKSSSAVSTAVLLAVARASGHEPAAEEVAHLSAEVSRSTRVSATGAFDDALAGLLPGIVLTDNASDRLLRRAPLDAGLEVALWIPEGEHPPTPDVQDRFRAHEGLGQRAVEAALRGEWWAAMELNSERVERVMGYPYEALRDAVRRRGAVASGTSGVGPAFAAVAPGDRIREVLGAFPSSGGSRRSARIVAEPALSAGGVA
jgi:shikimate kinase